MMQHNEQRQQPGCPSRRTGTENDAVTDSMLKNIFVMGNRTPTATNASYPIHERPALASALHQQQDLTADEFADFQSYPKQCSPTGAFTNGCSTAFDDFDDFVTAVDTISPKATSHTATDRYDVFRELDSQPNDSAFVNEPLPDCGDRSRICIWKKCLVTCKQLLQMSFNALIVSHGEESAIEALRSEPGSAFIQDLHQLHAMTRRIGHAVQSSCLNSAELNALLTDVEMTWRPLHSLFHKASHFPDTVSASSSPTQRQGKCYICLTPEPPELVLVNAVPYHACCANLWIHCVHSRLPTPK